MKSPGAAAVLMFAIGAASPAAEPAHDHGGMEHHPVEAAQATLGQSTYTAADLLFLTHMIVHHEQALALCALVPERSSREDFQRFARYVNDAQLAEIHQMQQLLRLAAERGASIAPQHLHGDPPMAGMLSKAQMTAIAAARGPEFERLWLEGMILHHQGAIDMALMQQQQQFRNGNQPWGVDVMVDEMLVGQRSEIGRMNAWLAQWR